MDSAGRHLLIEQLDKKLLKIQQLADIQIPPKGWIHAIRFALNMSLSQLGKRLKMTPVGVQEIEWRERDKKITLNKLIEVGEAMDMKFVYGFIPKDGSIQDLIDKRARSVAQGIVMRTSHTMKLEDQGNSEERLQKAIDDRTAWIRYQIPKYLWD